MTRSAATAKKLVDVLRLIAAGNSNAEIARELGVSEHAIKRRCQVLFKDIGARDRAHAVAIGYQRGFLVHHTTTCALLRPRVCDCGALP